MARVEVIHTDRNEVLAMLADRILDTRHVGSRSMGVDGAGKTIFASGLTQALRARGVTVASISVDDFHNPRSVRHRLGKDSPEGFWRDSHDYETLLADVLEPFAPDGTARYRTASHDLATDEPVHGGWITAQPDCMVVVEGISLHRDELVKCWDFSIFLDVAFEVTARRMAERDGSNADPAHASMRRYVEGQRIYLRACVPQNRADVLIDNTDPAAPIVVGR